MDYVGELAKYSWRSRQLPGYESLNKHAYIAGFCDGFEEGLTDEVVEEDAEDLFTTHLDDLIDLVEHARDVLDDGPELLRVLEALGL